MIAVESPMWRPSMVSTGKVNSEPRVSQSATAMWPPGGGARRSCSIPLWARAQRAFSL